ncbi:3-methyl-2-oxobutanoate dehydrogenase subunit VorB [Candidatus Neomarinimicrobiota bacterium]
MSTPELMKGNEALAKAAILAGCEAYFGYPITPQTELLEYMARELPAAGGVMIQAESELAAISMVYGGAGAGFRVMTSSSSPGYSLMQEGISYLAGAELPCLLVNVNRGGPGLGTIQPAQGDYFQAVKGGGHGDYHTIVLAPSTVQEMADFTYLGFDLADKYRTPVLILTDGALGQMMEKVTFPDYDPAEHVVDKPWATRGKSDNREKNVVTSLHLEPEKMELINLRLQAKYEQICLNETLWQEINTEDADYLIVAYGLSARIAGKVVDLARERGIKLGLLRPQTLYPFPYIPIAKLAETLKGVLTLELNAGQMVEDVRLAVEGRTPVAFYGRSGGMVPDPEEVLSHLETLIANGFMPHGKAQTAQLGVN